MKMLVMFAILSNRIRQRFSHFEHPIQDSATNRSFLLLSIFILGPQPSTNDSLVTIECVFRVTLQIVSRLAFPFGSSINPDLCNMTVSLRGSNDGIVAHHRVFRFSEIRTTRDISQAAVCVS